MMPNSHHTRLTPADRRERSSRPPAVILGCVLSRLLALVCAVAATVGASAVVAPVALAQEDEVFVDPGSPSGKEYELPIDRARQQAGTSTKKGSGSRKAPLFGAGVDRNATGVTGGTRSGANRTDDRRTSDSKRDSDSERRKTRGEADDAEREEASQEARETEFDTRALRAQAAAAPDGGIGIGGIVGAGIGVLLVGGLAGLWLRRRAT